MENSYEKLPSSTKKDDVKWMFRNTKGGWMRFRLGIFILLVAVRAVVSVAIAYVLMFFMDVATGETDFTLNNVIVIAAIILIIGGIVDVLASYVRASYIGKQEIVVRKKVLNKVFSASILDVKHIHTGEMVTRLTADTRTVAEFFPVIFNDIVGAVFLSLFALVNLFFLSWQVALVLFISLPVIMTVLSLFNFPMAKVDKRNKANDESIRVRMQENLRILPLIKAYSSQDNFMKNLSCLFERRYKSEVAFGTFEGFAFFVNSLLANLMLIITLGAGAYFVLQGVTTLGTLVAMVQLLNYILNPLSRMSRGLTSLAQAKVSAGRIREVADISSMETAKQPSLYDSGLMRIEAKGISFAYDTGADVFTDMSFSAKVGEITGIVGGSGIGKSTFLKVLMGLYVPSKGEVKLVGESWDSSEVLSRTAYVSSDSYLFLGTIAENICMMQSPDIKRLDEVVEMVNIRTFIDSLPEKYDSIVGEEGSKLSSGQAQRIAIARALYSGLPILVLDEPTANIDSENVKNLQNILKELSVSRICIVVTHDEEFLSVCDKVYQFDGNSAGN